MKTYQELAIETLHTDMSISNLVRTKIALAEVSDNNFKWQQSANGSIIWLSKIYLDKLLQQFNLICTILLLPVYLNRINVDLQRMFSVLWSLKKFECIRI